MIQRFVDRFMEKRGILRESLGKKHPDDYTELVRSVIDIISIDENDSVDSEPDNNRVHIIDDGDYQGTLVFVIAEQGYQPCEYWYLRISYGSCSGCDTLESIREYEDGLPSEKQIDDYITLSLHIVQGLRLMGDEEVGF